MAIEKEIRYNITCDTCGMKEEWPYYDGIEDAISVIRSNGWGVKRRGRAVGLVVCPEHNDFDNGD